MNSQTTVAVSDNKWLAYNITVWESAAGCHPDRAIRAVVNRSLSFLPSNCLLLLLTLFSFNSGGVIGFPPAFAAGIHFFPFDVGRLLSAAHEPLIHFPVNRPFRYPQIEAHHNEQYRGKTLQGYPRQPLTNLQCSLL